MFPGSLPEAMAKTGGRKGQSTRSRSRPPQAGACGWRSKKYAGWRPPVAPSTFPVVPFHFPFHPHFLLMHLEPWQWVLAVAAALLVGVSKTGIVGIGVLFVAIFANILPTKLASGFVLPLLIFGDVVAVASYRLHAQWRHLWRLFPWTVVGVMLGYLAMGRIDDRQARLLIGGIICTMVAMHLWRQWRGARKAVDGGRKTEDGRQMADPDPLAHAPAVARRAMAGRRGYKEDGTGAVEEEARSVWFAPTMGVLAGFTTLVANAAGPLMALYLLAMGLPKMEFVGTTAVFFLLLNLFKVPFMVNLGLITTDSFGVNLALAPAVWLGAWAGRKLLRRLNQKLFENLALGLAAVAGLHLLF